MEFTDVNGYYLPAEVDKYIDEQQAEIDSYKRTVKEEYAKREALEAEINKLNSDIEIMIQKAASKHRPAYDEQQECIMNMQTEIDELKKALESMTSKYSDLLIAKHRG